MQSTTLTKLCGGRLVVMPTAIPEAPFNKRFGSFAGNSSGSFKVLSKLGRQSTVFFPNPEAFLLKFFQALPRYCG